MTAHAPAKPQKLNPGKAVSRLGRLDVGKGALPAERLAKYCREEGGEMEPVVGLEPTTVRLQIECSTN